MRLLRIAMCAVLTLASGAAQQLTYDAFLSKLEQAAKLEDEKTYDRTIRDNLVHTVGLFRSLARAQLGHSDNESITAQIATLKASWERVYQSPMLEHMERWVSGLDIDDFRKFDSALNAFNSSYGTYTQLRNESVQERKLHETLRDTVIKLIEVFELLGEHYQAADAWGLVSQIDNTIPEKTIVDRKDGMFAIERFKEHREAWEMTKDRFYLENINWLKTERARIADDEKTAEQRAAAGYAEDVKGADAFLVVNADAAEKIVPLTFKVQQKQKVDLSIQGGPIPMFWPSVEVAEKGPTKLGYFSAVDLFVVRPGASRFGVTLEGNPPDPKHPAMTEIEVENKLKKPSLFHLDAAGTKPYAMWFYQPSAAEPFQGMTQNYASSTTRALVYYKSAASWVGEVDGTQITLYDDNSNGKLFEEDPLAYGYFVRTLTGKPDDETKLPALDSMKIGKERQQPYSEWVKVGGAWFHMRPKNDGASLGLRPTNPEYFKTGTAQLAWTGPKTIEVEVLVIQGRGDIHGARFDLAGGAPVEVPAGSYNLVFGRVLSGKGARLITADILPGSMPEIVVEAGKPATVTIGAPFKLDYTRSGEGRDLKIDALTIKVVGVGGEIYMHVNGAVPSPQVLAAKAADGKGAKVVGEFAAIIDPEVASAFSKSKDVGKLGYWSAFFPIVKGAKEATTKLEAFVDEGMVVGLSEPKNKLFGALEPIYK